MIGRVLWLATLASIAAVTALLQLDRQAGADSTYALLVPQPFRGYAQLHVAAAALQRDDTAVPLAAAKALIRSRPMPSEHLSLLAIAQAKAGQLEASAFSFEMAGKRGWRDPVAQEIVLRLALDAGDKSEAARRYAALLWNEGTKDELLIALGSQVFDETSGAGRETLAPIIASATRWHSHFLQRGLAVLPPEAFAEVVARAMVLNARFECEPLKRAVDGLRRRDAAAGAALGEIVSRQCP